MPDLENFRLKVFRAVAAHCNFRKAAEELRLTQPAVSAQIKALEAELEVQLFNRTNGRVALTDAGHRLLDYAHQSQAILSSAIHSLDAFRPGISGSLELGASTTIAQYALLPTLGRFAALYPSVSIHLISGNTEQIVMALQEQKIQLGLIEGPAKSAEIHTESFLKDELVLIVPTSADWANAPSITPADLRHLPLLLRESGSGTRDVVLAALAKKSLPQNTLKIVMELDSTEAIKAAVAAGLGAGFVSRSALCQDSRTDKNFRILKIDALTIQRSFQCISLHGQPSTGPAAAFRQHLFSAIHL